MADSLLVNTYRPEEGLMFFDSLSREDITRIRDILNGWLGEDPATPRRLCDAAPTEPAPASCTSLLDGEGDWWVEVADRGFIPVSELGEDDDPGESAEWVEAEYGIDPGEQPVPNPVGAVVYVTGDEAETGHYHPVGAEVTVVPNDDLWSDGDDFGFVLTADSEGFNQWIAEADLDIQPPTGPYHTGAQVRLFNGETAIIVEDLGTQTDAFGRDHHFYTVAREDNPFPPGASATPGAATFTADFIDGPTGDAPWTPWDVKRLVRNLAEESLGE